jgi:hypothetical protein
MTAFISHAFQNKPEFENIVDALEQRGVPYWNPEKSDSNHKPGMQVYSRPRQRRITPRSLRNAYVDICKGD